MSDEKVFTPVILSAEQMNRKTVIPFNAVVGAGANVTIVSSKIDIRRKITKIEIHFPDNANDLLRVSAHVDDNETASTTNAPSGTNLISRFSSTPYVIGHGSVVVMDIAYIPSFYQTYIKAYFANTNAYAVTATVLITVESISDAEAQDLLADVTTDYKIKDTSEYTQEMINKANAKIEMANETLKGTYPAMKEHIDHFKATDNDVIGDHQKRYMNAMNIVAAIPTTAPLEDRYKFAKAWMDNAVGVTKDITFETGLIQAVTSVFGVGVTDWGRFLEETFGLQSKTNTLLDIAFQKGLYKPVEQFWNKMYQPEYPSTNELINMVVKEKITVKDFQEIMTYHGFSNYWTGKMWDAHFIPPNYENIKEAYWRGNITDEEIDDYLKRVDLDPYYNDKIWKNLLEEIPPYTDLINMRVKEVIPQEMFTKGLAAHGFKGNWASYLWDAHFTPPSFIDFLTAFRRKESVTIPHADGTTETYQFGQDTTQDITKIKELAILADYDPRYWDFFNTRTYNDPTARQARWAYESGDLNKDEVYDVILRTGLKPEDAKWFTKMQTSFQERPFITRYLNGLMTAYIKKAITADELRARVTAIPRNVELADWIIKIADLQTETSKAQVETTREKLLSVSELKNMFARGIINETDFRTKLQLLGYETLDIQLIVDLITQTIDEKEGGAKKASLSTTEYFNAYKYKLMDEDNLRTNLLLRGLTMDEANLLIETKKAMWRDKGWEA